jgi:hypothetical protein
MLFKILAILFGALTGLLVYWGTGSAPIAGAVVTGLMAIIMTLNSLEN